MTILIADDENTIRQGLCTAVDWASMGFEQVLQAEDGRKAMDLIETLKPDVALLDIRMPEMTGLEILARLKDMPDAPKCILLSGYSEFEYAVEALRNNAGDYLVKPCSIEELTAAVSKVAGLAADRCPPAREDGATAPPVSPQDPQEPQEPGAPLLSPAVDKALRYMRAHLADQDLSLGKVAREVLFLHPDYFGKLFKKETGERFGTLLMKMRISAAMDIIDKASERPKVAVLARAVGLGDNATYFSQAFRKQAGCLPSQYAKGGSGHAG
ncbi:MAG: response regulator [Lachnospiraceae bacterium]|jgi:YesN/AraC family two-component response regulator|nr:response regulator [Lachnospiraceae bacterium]